MAKVRADLEKGIEGEGDFTATSGGDTEEWNEAAQKGHGMRGELRAQFELPSSYGEPKINWGNWEKISNGKQEKK